MHVLEWDGCTDFFFSRGLYLFFFSNLARTPAPLVDADRYVFAHLGGRPRDPNWDCDVTTPATELMEEAAAGMYEHVFYGVSYGKHGKAAPAGKKTPRRGGHRAKTVGESMGSGQETPTPFFHTVLNTIVLASLLATKPFKRIAGFTNVMFQAFQPDIHAYYQNTLDALHEWNPTLKRNFARLTSVFTAATFNFGPSTITLPHLDFANLAWGWCAITALGRFDPNKGGHLILWDLMLIIRFPPGSTILIPSAIVRHSNVSIQQGESRFSFTQFTAAGIFRFVHNGFRTDKSLREEGMTDAQKLECAQERRARWVDGLKMYRTWDVAFE
ncbi:hypothetical protein B0H11DRAFT_1756505 [Mycena galericulata]|nr:hypothetical protein B0H11DRAFT_1756505 [Mycena galericulata]